ncbi:LysR family transcriptional regulator [Enterobacter chuandaensis]
MRYNNNRLMKDWVVFITVVETCSFTLSAKKLFCSVASVSKSIARLEDILEVVLLSRNAHKVQITAAGFIAYNRAKEIYQVYQALFSELTSRDNRIKGKLRFSAPSVLCEYAASRWVYDYMHENKDAELRLLSRDRTELTTASPEFDDLVLKSGELNSADLVHHKLGTMKFSMCASPAYLEKHGEINSPDDLKNHWIMKSDHPFLDYPITLTKSEQSIELNIDSSTCLVSNSMSSMLKMSLEGSGVCLALPTWIISNYVKNKQLVLILPEWEIPEMQIYLVWRYRERYSNLFIDFRRYIQEKWAELLEQGSP